jgi:hypothetical protein
MKVARVTFLTLLAALVAVGVSTTSYAFHGGGVAECGGCHSMHAANQAGGHLLIGLDASSTCLACHQKTGDTGPSSYHISTADGDMPTGTAPKQRTPGGDFGWLKKGYQIVSRGTTTNELAETHGHNIVAAGFGYIADPVNTTAPGGSFVSAGLGCQSCHDPHGRGRRAGTDDIPTFSVPVVGGLAGLPIKSSGSYNNSAAPDASGAVGIYRILAYPGYTGAAGVTWGGWPIAVAPSTYNQTEATNQVRVAYGGTVNNTWASWCASCHPDMHTGSGRLVHPVDEALGADLAANYNAYKKSGDLSGVVGSSFSSLVPFAEATSNFTTLKSHAANNAATYAGAGTGDKVTCLSCHRAHATAFPEMLRWNMENEFMVVNSVYQIESRGRTNAEAVASYYDRQPTAGPTPFATYQRVLCNKCHAKD